MTEIIRVENKFYILADSSLTDDQNRVLKFADTFAVFDRHGDISPLGFENQGLFHSETRFLSRFILFLNGKRPLFLSSNVKEENDFLVADLTNPDFEDAQGHFISKGTIHLIRTVFLADGQCYQRIQAVNYGGQPVRFTLGIELEADFCDIFEVRGIQRERRGVFLPTEVSQNRITRNYEGLDHKKRSADLTVTPVPEEISDRGMTFHLELAPKEVKNIDLSLLCRIESPPRDMISFDSAYLKTQKLYKHYNADSCRITTSNEQFNDWLKQSRADLHMLMTDTRWGYYPYAGIPWFSTVFGRDGIITAIETLWYSPDIAKGVLSYLAAHQAEKMDPSQDAEPGKILHEERRGEMADLREVPFGHYYGTIDATPLFVILAGLYYERTGDFKFLKKIWPNIERALYWIDHYGDSDKDGFVEYKVKSDGGLSNQGWKDSNDSVFHANGDLAEAPIALCEVQGYVYAAKVKASHLARVLGFGKKAVYLKKEAAQLKERFNKKFWSSKIESFGIALDGKKKLCEVRSSNAGHCLFTEIADAEKAQKMVKGLLSKDSFSGWGVRTLPSHEARYNPMSYHNGSIWPHDNALIADGLARYGFKKEAAAIAGGLFDASIFLELHRMPELFCGFDRREGEGPTHYPVACDPQAWAAGAVYLLLQSFMGLAIKAEENKIYFERPYLPDFLREIRIENLRIKDNVVDLSVERNDHGVTVNVRRKKGHVDLVTTK